MTAKDAADVYLKTVDRLEPDLHPIDRDGALASIAISLKRIADAMDSTILADRVQDAIYNALVNADRQKHR